MSIHRVILKTANSLVNTTVMLALCLASAYAVYALWDNNRIYSAAADVQAEMIKLKPRTKSVQESDEGDSFEELLAVNSDVCAWVTLDNTGVDYPVLQGDTNHSYINTDVYGNFALAGSIFLDSRNDNTFEDQYSLLYGHHMENGKMFGDLDLYKEADFFTENRTGTLILPDQIYDLEIISCMLVSASEDNIFEPERWQDDIDGLLDFIKQNSLNICNESIDSIALSQEDEKILALSTCSSEFTDARTIVLAIMKPCVSVK